jgi:exonuclease III
MKDSFYEELEQVFNQLPMYHIKILLGDNNVKLGRKDYHKPTIRNESLQEIKENKYTSTSNVKSHSQVDR